MDVREEEKRECGKGEPKPRWPTGGNLELVTSFCASSTVYKRGTRMPWAPESRAPVDVLLTGFVTEVGWRSYALP